MKSLLILALCLGMLSWSGAAVAGYVPILDFEDLYPGYPDSKRIPSWGYQGISWSPSSWWITKDFASSGWGEVYKSGIIGKVGIFNETSVSGFRGIYFHYSTFDFLGAYFTGARQNWDLTVEGSREGAVIYSTTITAIKDTPKWFDLNFTDVDWVTITPHPVGNPSSIWGDFVMDNVNAPLGGDGEVPICSTLLLLGSGLLGLLALRRRRLAHA